MERTLSLTTDYATSTGSPGVYLKRIADAGFSHVHWCHQWNTDFLYGKAEVDHIAAWLAEYGLAVIDLHGSAGVEKRWGSRVEYEREAGVELVANRIEMTARLESDVCIMHLPPELFLPDSNREDWDRLYRSLDELHPLSMSAGVRIAIENGDFDRIQPVLERYESDFVGVCYDSGHGNLIPDGIERLNAVRDRLISVHLHDNDGTADQHLLPFTGTVDWRRLAAVMADSVYRKCVSMESAIGRTGIDDEQQFLRQAYERGMRFAQMIDDERG